MPHIMPTEMKHVVLIAMDPIEICQPSTQAFENIIHTKELPMALFNYDRIRLESKQVKTDRSERVRYQNIYAHTKSKVVKQMKFNRQKGK